MPAAMAVLFVLLQSDDCGQLVNGRIPFTCTPVGVGIIRIAMTIILLPPVLMWLRFLQRILKYQDERANEDEDQILPRNGDIDFESGSKDIGMGQVLLSGRIEEVGRDSHIAVVNGERVSFLSVYPFQKGWLQRGDFVHVVYQHISILRNSKTILAYADAATRTVRGASAWVYSLWVPLLAICIIIFANFKLAYGDLMVGLCAALLVLDLGYLSLMVRARSKLRSHLNSGTDRIDSSGYR